jgi:methylenetetrahydrofolate dehydrogenase (NADP+)/methenyltetrahydrofolate cyclohydrolase
MSSANPKPASARVIDGKSVAVRLRADITARVKALGFKPGLAVILVGNDPASHIYVSNKIKACVEAGFESYEIRMDQSCSQLDISQAIRNLNDNADVHGILLQLPLPAHLDEDELIQMIDPAKDVDGLTLRNVGALVTGMPGLIPCTPQGALLLVKEIKKDLTGLNAVVIGRSLLFGKPMAQLLLREDCTVTQAHSRTRNLETLCKNADILIAAVGRPNMVKGEWIKPGAIVIDVGINRLDSGKLCGDVDFNEAVKVAGAITPVPGGVGPMTIACLLSNTLKAAKAARTRRRTDML